MLKRAAAQHAPLPAAEPVKPIEPEVLGTPEISGHLPEDAAAPKDTPLVLLDLLAPAAPLAPSDAVDMVPLNEDPAKSDAVRLLHAKSSQLFTPILDLMRKHVSMTVKDMAKQLTVGNSTVHRALTILQLAGDVRPIKSKFCKGGTWVLTVGKPYKAADASFTKSSIFKLVTALRDCPGSSVAMLATSTGQTQDSVYQHLQRMLDYKLASEVVNGQLRQYFVSSRVKF